MAFAHEDVLESLRAIGRASEQLASVLLISDAWMRGGRENFARCEMGARGVEGGAGVDVRMGCLLMYVWSGAVAGDEIRQGRRQVHMRAVKRTRIHAL